MFVAPLTVATPADYTFEVGLSTPVPGGGSIRLRFSPGLDLTLSQDPNTSEIPCSATYGFKFPGNAKCTVTAPNELEFTGAFPSAEFLLIFTL